MKQVCIYERNGWRLVSHGNGWGYALFDDENHTSAWFQDDDAHEFRVNIMGDDGFLVDNCEERFADYSELMAAE